MGAMTLPWVSTTSPPKRIIMNIIGTSQYFFRVDMNRQSSERNDIHSSAKLIVDALVGVGPGYLMASQQVVAGGRVGLRQSSIGLDLQQISV
jgi:hypothetical protein